MFSGRTSDPPATAVLACDPNNSLDASPFRCGVPLTDRFDARVALDPDCDAAGDTTLAGVRRPDGDVVPFRGDVVPFRGDVVPSRGDVAPFCGACPFLAGDRLGDRADGDGDAAAALRAERRLPPLLDPRDDMIKVRLGDGRLSGDKGQGVKGQVKSRTGFGGKTAEGGDGSAISPPATSAATRQTVDMLSPAGLLTAAAARRLVAFRRCLCASHVPSNLFETRVENKDTTEWSRSVYPPNPTEIGLREPKLRARTDPRTTSIILFPGQGSQYVGMGSDLLDFPNVPEMFEVAKRVLGYDILDICLNGPKLALDRTDYSQAAVFLVSLAAVEKLRFEKPTAVENCVATAGFSLGELTALVLAGALDFEDALRLVKIRGEVMKSAAEECQSGLMNIIYGADGRVRLACSSASDWCIRKGVHPDHAVCAVAYYLFPHCKVIGGHEEALKFIEQNKRDFGIKKCSRLPDSGAFHTRVMEQAAITFQSALERTRISDPKIPVVSNTQALPMKSADGIRRSLKWQLSSPSKLEQILHGIYSRPRDLGLPFTFQCGPGTSILDVLDKVNFRARKQAFRVYS